MHVSADSVPRELPHDAKAERFNVFLYRRRYVAHAVSGARLINSQSQRFGGRLNELPHLGGRPLAEYAQRPYDRDILVRVIVPKEDAKFCYQSVRNSQTDIPVLTCAAAKNAAGEYRFAIGARPGKAVLYTLPADAGETPELTSARFAASIRSRIKTESNMRGSAEYRNHLAGVLVKRAVKLLG